MILGRGKLVTYVVSELVDGQSVRLESFFVELVVGLDVLLGLEVEGLPQVLQFGVAAAVVLAVGALVGLPFGVVRVGSGFGRPEGQQASQGENDLHVGI